MWKFGRLQVQKVGMVGGLGEGGGHEAKVETWHGQ